MHRLSHRSMLGLVVKPAPRTVFLSSRKLLPSPSHRSTVSLRLHLCGMIALTPMLLLLLSPHSIGLLNRSSDIVGQIRTYRRDDAWSASLCQTFFAMTMGVQIPFITEKPLAACGCRKFQIDAMGDHLCTCTTHSGAKKAHDWEVDQLADLFHTTHTVKTQQVTKIRGRYCLDVELSVYLANAAGPVPLVLDLRIAHDRFGSSSDPNLNGQSHYPNDIDKSRNETATDKIQIRK